MRLNPRNGSTVITEQCPTFPNQDAAMVSRAKRTPRRMSSNTPPTHGNTSHTSASQNRILREIISYLRNGISVTIEQGPGFPAQDAASVLRFNGVPRQTNSNRPLTYGHVGPSASDVTGDRHRNQAPSGSSRRPPTLPIFGDIAFPN